MISQIVGSLLSKDIGRVELMTAGGTAYELTIPLGVYETLPRTGEKCTLHTFLVVKEDAWHLYGFATPFERRVFQRVLDAKGVDMLAKMPGKPEVQASLLMTFMQVPTNFVRTLIAGPQNFMYVLDARKRDLESK